MVKKFQNLYTHFKYIILKQCANISNHLDNDLSNYYNLNANYKILRNIINFTGFTPIHQYFFCMLSGIASRIILKLLNGDRNFVLYNLLLILFGIIPNLIWI